MLHGICYPEEYPIETSTTHTPLKIFVTESSEDA
jgi:hypothetical protein